MEKRNTLLLTVIAIATLLVAVVGATFAYFAGSQTATNVVNVTATLPSSTTVFYTTGDGDISISVTEADMQKAAANETVDKGNMTKTLSAVLTTSSTTEVYCTYDVEFEFTNSSTYTPTNDNKKEFTVAIASSATGTGSSTSVVTASYGEENIEAKKVLTGQKITATNGDTTINHVITVKLYNIDEPQPNLVGKTITGNYKITNVQC